MNRSLRETRIRLTLTVAAIFFVVGMAATVGVWLAISREEYASIDDSLASQAQLVISGLQSNEGQVSFDGHPLPNVTAEGEAVGTVVLDTNQHVLTRSGTVPTMQSMANLAEQAAGTGHTVIATVAGQGSAQRILVEAIPRDTGVSGVLAISRPLREVHQTLFQLAVLLGATLLGLSMVVALLAYAAAGRAMTPVRAMTATLQRFTADAAHELRAPLTLMRAELETSLSRSRSLSEHRATETTVLHEAEHLGAVADQLLTLARADAGALELERQAVDMGDLVDETVARWVPLANAKAVALRAAVSRDCTLQGDQLLLRRLLDNLVDNAIRHTPSQGAVLLSLGLEDNACTIRVGDTGPGVPEARRATLFDRFTRGDDARGRDAGGAGLGLALCSVIARAHGGSMALEASEGGASFRVTLPMT